MIRHGPCELIDSVGPDFRAHETQSVADSKAGVALVSTSALARQHRPAPGCPSGDLMTPDVGPKSQKAVRGLGFEPRQTEPKSVVLPLHHPRGPLRILGDR